MIDHLHLNMLNGLANRPPGARFQVWKCYNPPYMSPHVCHASQIPSKPSRMCGSRYLNAMGYVNRRVVKRPMLTKRHRLGRHHFAKKFSTWSAVRWQNVIFSDEKLFRTRPGAHVRCWKQKTASKFAAKYVHGSVQRPQGLMVWAAINGAGRLVLQRCVPKINASAYQATLATDLAFIRPRYLVNGSCSISHSPPLQALQIPLHAGRGVGSPSPDHHELVNHEWRAALQRRHLAPKLTRYEPN